jgi:NADPH-dependent 2,4-dienoyl-CoA reductase/sulfur reductase-like enzyme
MIEKDIDLAIIGGGPAGLAAAIAAKGAGVRHPLIIERNKTLGGILGQCIHDGFGLEIYKESLTGPEYMEREIKEIRQMGIQYMLSSMVTNLTSDRELEVVNFEGVHKLHAKAVILAMGCRERTRGALGIPGNRPAGIFTAGAAQYFVNIKNYMVGSKVVILGSGDIGLIMARRLTLEDAKILAVVEKLPYPSGLPRNVTQCLEDFNIPLMVSHTIVDIKGKKRVTGVTIARVDHKFKPIPKTDVEIPCDTLIISAGLIPENELSQKAGIILDPNTNGPQVDDKLQTNIPGIFAAGNVLHVHDIVDWVSLESARAGRNAADYIKRLSVLERACTGSKQENGGIIHLKTGPGIKYALPQKITSNSGQEAMIYLRVKEPAENIFVTLRQGRKYIKKFKQRKVHPAVMIRLKFNKEVLSPTKELLVELQEK